MLFSGNARNALLLAAVVVCALSVVTSQHKARKLYIELQKETELALQMEVEWGQLQLEQSTWATPARVEKIAVQQLRMQLPGNGQVQFIKIEPTTQQPSPQSSDGSGGSPHLNPLLELLAIRLGHQITMAKSLVIPPAGEEAIVPSPLGMGDKSFNGGKAQP